MPELNRHSGKSVLVTGSASGIGLGIVQRFLAEGAQVTGLDLNETEADGALSITGDATDEEAVQAAVDKVVMDQGGLDVMVCNAGVIAVQPIVEMDFAEWKRVMEINVNSVFLGSRAAARAMIAQGRGGVIVNASSGAGRRGVPNLSHYCASKAAILMLTQSLAIEVAPYKIRANCYVPGHIETPFWGGIAEGFAKVTGQTPEAVIEGFRQTVPWGRFGTADDVAGAVSWLASPDGEYVSGQAIGMNGAEFPF